MKKSSLYAQFEQHKDSVDDGIWTEIIEADGETPAVRVKLRSSRSKAAKRVRNEIAQRALAKGGRFNRNEEAEVIEVLSRAIVVDWDGVTDREGNELPCTQDNVAMICKDLEVFRERLTILSATDETFRKEAVERTVGNSPSTTDTD